MSEAKIGKYEILETLGRGAIGIVYKARDPNINRIVAIKVLKSIFIGEEDRENIELQRFYQEAQSAGNLRHSNIVAIFDAGCPELGAPYIVMDFIDGTVLRKVIEDEGPLEPDFVLTIVTQLAGAIDYAHGEGVLHRDINPGNIMIDKKGRPFLADFSLAKLRDSSLTPTGSLVGSPGYMAPELIKGNPADERVDIFSLGVLTYEMLTKKLPFPGEDMVRMMYTIMHEEPRSFASYGLSSQPEVEEVLHRCLTKERGERYQTAMEFTKALGAALFPMGAETQKLPAYHPKEPRVNKKSFIEVAKPNKEVSEPIKKEGKTKLVWEKRKRVKKKRNVLPVLLLSIVLASVVVALKLGAKPKEISALSEVELSFFIKEMEVQDPFAKTTLEEVSKRQSKALILDSLKFYESNNEVIRIELVKKLADKELLQEEQVKRVLIKALRDKDYLVKGFALSAIVLSADSSFKPALEEMKKEEKDERVLPLLERTLKAL